MYHRQHGVHSEIFISPLPVWQDIQETSLLAAFLSGIFLAMTNLNF
jgi:hypothetical protein